MTVQLYSVPWEVGAHVPFCKEIYPSLVGAISEGMYSLQIFMGNPKSYTRQCISDDDIHACQMLLERYPTHVFTHFPYIANLAGRSKRGGLAWSGDISVDRSVTMMLSGLEYELAVVARIGKGVVIHPGSFPDREVGHKAVSQTINRIQFTSGGMLLLENCAGEGNKLCRTFTEIKSVMTLVNDKNLKHIGVCVDTAHIWGQGDYDLREILEVERLFHDFEEELGIENFRLLHLNDSQVKLGSKKDRHAPIGMGEIWSGGQESLICLLDKCREYEIPMVLETGGPCMFTLSQLVKKINT
jgi:apurinic endonuclease APN1